MTDDRIEPIEMRRLDAAPEDSQTQRPASSPTPPRPQAQVKLAAGYRHPRPLRPWTRASQGHIGLRVPGTARIFSGSARSGLQFGQVSPRQARARQSTTDQHVDGPARGQLRRILHPRARSTLRGPTCHSCSAHALAGRQCLQCARHIRSRPLDQVCCSFLRGPCRLQRVRRCGLAHGPNRSGMVETTWAPRAGHDLVEPRPAR